MYLEEFHRRSGDSVHISADQASRFAKEIANDFNPIHNPDSNRFCIPGDLLFALALAQYGISPSMTFVFTGMVGDNETLNFPTTTADTLEITFRDKPCMRIERSGIINHDEALIEAFSRRYVAFSGQNFPHMLQPLLEAQQVMLNPERPLVIYERMSFHLDLDQENLDPILEVAKAKLQVNGKRGEVNLAFIIQSNGKQIGQGSKRLIVSGLRAYDAVIAHQLMQEYLDAKAAYQNRL
ncbi:DUF3581 family protein [Thiolinea disciformis]|uniref:DUF3581 family protein n=1 Tax=Thiolinea disciformis TaxID=125614 RepID=UPI00037F2973|nr:DUF3581 family protein [Thiolinea disciformis]